jgi:hypothetical protein
MPGAPVGTGRQIALGEETMGRINCTRVIVGGIVAAVILFIAGFIIHGLILEPDWTAWHAAGHMPLVLSHAAMTVIWIVVSLINGLTGVWIYAGIRPRYGAGAKTALIAGLMLWLVGGLVAALAQYALGNVPHNIVVVGAIGSLIADLIAIVAGAYFYQEA